MTAGHPEYSKLAAAPGVSPDVDERCSAARSVKRYGDVEVIHGIDLSIDPGEFTVFVGPSGCGKSTLLRMIAGLEPISGGNLLIDGAAHERGAGGQARHRHGVPELRALPAYAVCAEPGLRAGNSAGAQGRDRKQRVSAAAAILRIEPLLKRKPKQLSGGQRQRVAIGRAIVREPEDLPVRRAAVQPRCRAARADARGDRQTPQRPRQHHDLCHARPGGGR